MKAVQIIGYEQAEFTEVPDPAPKADELLIRVRRVGVCYSDVEVFCQDLSIYRDGGAHLPIIPGHEWAGDVIEAGKQVVGFKTGDRVTGECGIGCGICDLCLQGLHNICPNRVETGVFNRNGAYAEYLTVPYQYVHHLRSLSYQEGALIEPLTVGIWIARRAEIQPGDRVAVIGTGTVGLSAVHVAHFRGANLVAAFGRKPFKLKFTRQLGADFAINLYDGNLKETVQELTQGKGFNVVIEATGVSQGGTQALCMAMPRGKVVITGVFEEITQSIDLNTIMPKELKVIGSLGGPLVFDEAIQLVDEGKLQLLPIQTHLYPLSHGPAALRMVAEERPDLVKIHLDCTVE